MFKLSAINGKNLELWSLVDTVRVMKTIFAVCLIFCVWSAVQAQEWADSLDIPLPADFVELEQGRLEFDAPGGRMLELHFLGQSESQSIAAFYNESLPQLGWDQKTNEKQGNTNSYVFEREAERLTILIVDKTSETELVLRLVPIE